MSLFNDGKHHITRGSIEYGVFLCREDGRPVVNVEQVEERHSPTGFEWGYGGSGPADLAYNILLHYTDKATAERYHQDFKSEFIATLPDAGGLILSSTILDWLNRKEVSSDNRT